MRQSVLLTESFDALVRRFGAAKGRTMVKFSIFESEARVALAGAADFDRVRAPFGMTMTMTTTTTMREGYG